MAPPRSLVPDIRDDQKPLRAMFQRRPPVYQTDDRMRQSQHYRGIAYIAISALENIIGGASVKVKTRNTIKKSTSAAVVSPNDQELSEASQDHPVSQLVLKPNLNQTINDLLRSAVVQYHLTGSARFWGVPNHFDQPIELYSLPTAFMTPSPSSPEYPHGAWRFMSPYSGMAQIFIPGFGSVVPGTVIDRRDIFDLTSYNPLSLNDGYSPLTAGSIQLDVLESIDQSRKSAMDNGFTPDAVVTVEGASKEDLDRLQAEWEDKHSGSDNFRRVLFSNGMGVDVSNLSTNPKEMDYGSGWDQMTKFCLALFGMSASIAGLAETGSFSELYAKLQQVYALKVGPFCKMLSALLTREIAQKYDPDCVIEITPPTIQDREFDEKQWQDDAAKGSVTWNEYRARRNLPPIDGGDELMAKGPPGQQDQQQGQPQAGDDQQAAGDDAGAGGDAPPPDATPGDVVESGVMSMLGMGGDESDAQPAGFEAKSMNWDENKHKRGNPNNKGQFSSSGGAGGGGSVKPAKLVGKPASGWGPFKNGHDQVAGSAQTRAKVVSATKPGHARVTSAIPTAKPVNGSWNDPQWVKTISSWATKAFQPVQSMIDHFQKLEDRATDAMDSVIHSAYAGDAAYAIRQKLGLVSGGEEAARKQWDTTEKIDTFAKDAAKRHAAAVAAKFGKKVEPVERALTKLFADMAEKLAKGDTKQPGVVRARIKGIGTFSLNRPGQKPAAKPGSGRRAAPSIKNSAGAGSIVKKPYAGRESLAALFKSRSAMKAILKSLNG